MWPSDVLFGGGYRLVDAGPHPNRRHAGRGRRLQRPESDPATAETMRWIFAQRIGGRSRRDRARVQRARRAPVGRPGLQPTPRGLAVVVAVGDQDLGRPALHGLAGVEPDRCRPRPPDREWSAAVGAATGGRVGGFVPAQAVQVARIDQCGRTCRYRLSGSVRCGQCKRRMDSHWGCMVVPATDAATAGPARTTRAPTCRNRCTCARTISWRPSPPARPPQRRYVDVGGGGLPASHRNYHPILGERLCRRAEEHRKDKPHGLRLIESECTRGSVVCQKTSTMESREISRANHSTESHRRTVSTRNSLDQSGEISRAGKELAWRGGRGSGAGGRCAVPTERFEVGLTVPWLGDDPRRDSRFHEGGGGGAPVDVGCCEGGRPWC